MPQRIDGSVCVTQDRWAVHVAPFLRWVPVPVAAERIQFRPLNHARRVGTALIALVCDPIMGADRGEGGGCQQTLRRRLA